MNDRELYAWLDQQEARIIRDHEYACDTSIYCTTLRHCERRNERLEPVKALRAVLDERKQRPSYTDAFYDPSLADPAMVADLFAKANDRPEHMR